MSMIKRKVLSVFYNSIIAQRDGVAFFCSLIVILKVVVMSDSSDSDFWKVVLMSTSL